MVIWQGSLESLIFMSSRLLIVGGAGFIGRNLTQKAVESGLKTTVLSLNSIANDCLISDVEYLQADISNSNHLGKVLEKRNFDYVINLAGYIDHSDFLNGGRGIIKTHFDGVQNLLQVLDWKNLKKFIQIGSSDEYGDQIAPQSEDVRESPISSYSAGKVFATHLLQMLHKTQGLPVVILRLFLVYGPGQGNDRFLPQVIDGCISGLSFPASKGNQYRDFCYVDDISAGILLALDSKKSEGEVINLASGIPISIREVIELVKKNVGKGSPNFGKIPYRVGENMNLYADIKKAKKMLKWAPSISIEDGIRQTINFQISKK